jgi:type-F conjugative transfer system pilin assembly protein TrbC
MYKNSLQQTQMRAWELNQSGAEWDIAPATFRTFNVTRVPAIILSDAQQTSALDNGCSANTEHLRVDGDVSLHQALTLMKQQGNGKLAKAADLFLDIENR